MKYDSLDIMTDFADFACELSLARDIESITRIVSRFAKYSISADGATFILRENETCYYADEESVQPLWKGKRFPLSSCISGWVILNEETAVIQDIYSDNRIPADTYKPTFVKSLLMVPIRSSDPLGAIGVYWARNHLPSPEEKHVLQTVANTTAVSIESINTKKQMEVHLEALTDERQRLDRIMKGAHVGTWEWDIVKDEIFCSDQTLELFGFTNRAEFNGKLEDLARRIHLGDVKRWRESLEACVTRGAEHNIDYRIILPSGKIRWISATGNADRNAEDKAIRIMGTLIDITNRKQAEEHQRIDNEKFTSLMKHTSEGFYLFEMPQPVPVDIAPREQIRLLYRGKIVECNDAQAKMYGYDSREELIGRSLTELHGGAEIEENVAFLEDWIGNQYSITGAVSKETDKEGKTVWFSNNITGIIEENALIRIWGTQTDISQIKKAEEELHRQTQIISQVHDSIATTDIEGYITSWNKGAEKLHGFTAEEVIGRNVEHLFPQKFRKVIRDIIHNKLTKTDTHSLEAPIRTKTGDGLYVHLSISLLKDDMGKVIGTIGYAVDITERKRTEETLRKNEENLRITLASIGDGVIATDTSGQIKRMNPVAEKLTDYTFDNAKNRHLDDVFRIVNSRTRKPVENLVNKILATGTMTGITNHTMLISRYGTEYPITQSGTPIRDDEGKIVGVVLVFHDVTEEYAMREALRQSERDMKRAQSLAHVGSWRFDFNTDMAYGSEETRRIYGFDENEIPIKVIQSVPLSEYRSQLDTAMRGLTKDGKGYDVTFRIRRFSDGAIRDIHSLAEYDAEQNIVYGMLQDITEQKKAEIELIESRTRLALALEAANLGTWDWHIPSNKAIYNNRWAQAKGYDPSEIKPHFSSFEDLIHPEDFPRVRQNINDHLDGNTKFYNATFRMKHKSGNWLWITDRGKVVERDEKGKAIRVCGVNQDITETKLLNERLRQAEKMEAIGALAGGIAHDFNNILGGIFGYAEMSLLDLPEGSHLAENISRILQAGKRAKNLVSQILAFSRKGYENKSPQYLHPVVREVVSLIRASLPSTIEIKEYIAKDTQPVLADPTKIHEILMNLCTNAAHAMNDKGTLEVRYEEVYESREIKGRTGTIPPGGYSLITINDTGIGMDESTLTKIFDPFFTTKPEGKGTGMGLAVVFGIVQTHNGAITVESTPGKGTSFRIYLPKCPDEVQRGTDTSKQVESGYERILFVDDEKLICKISESILTKLGYEVVTFTNSKKALDYFSQYPDTFDLVITDQTMPNITGLELSRKIKEVRPSIPVIIATGYSKVVDEKKALAAGLDGYIRKPFHRSEIAHKIRSVLGENRVKS
ncbi:MAG: PAS domain S-box protein [Chitinispirillaceae bacterium]